MKALGAPTAEGGAILSGALYSAMRLLDLEHLEAWLAGQISFCVPMRVSKSTNQSLEFAGRIAAPWFAGQQKLRRLLDAAKGLSSEQVAFLRAMVALNVTEWTPYDAIVRHAEALYSGQIRYNWKDIPAIYLKGLANVGMIEFRKKAKKDTKTPEGRGGKAADTGRLPASNGCSTIELAAPWSGQEKRIGVSGLIKTGR